jgi:hypothetical protein
MYPMSLAATGASLSTLSRSLLGHDIAHLGYLLLHQLHLRLMPYPLLLGLLLQVGHLGGKYTVGGL